MNMKNLKILFCLFFLLSIGSTNVWGAVEYSITGSGTSKTLTITGTGAIPDYNTTTNTAPWNGEKSNIKYIVIGKNITTIGEYAFNGISGSNGEITIPTTVTTFKNHAFDNCTTLVSIKYDGTPNEWANITFESNTAHPFGKYGASDAVKSARKYYFNKSATATTDLIFTPGITSIKAYAFYNGNFSSVHIPGTVTNLYSYSLASNFSNVYVNNKTAPTCADNYSITFSKTGVLHVPSEATGYTTNTKKWKKDASYNSNGYNSITYHSTSGTVDGQSWSLDKNGVLTISGSGALTTSFRVDDEATRYPYYYFRFLVDKVIITGGITELSNILQRAQAMRTLEFQQDNISSATTVTPTSYIYDSPITMLFPYTAVENVNLSTWSSYKRQLSNAANIDQSEDNVSLLAALHNNLTEPFNMNLTRTLSNTMYNTYCSPIDMSAEEVTALFGEGTHLVELDAENTGMNEDDELVIAFKDATEITAGTPYLIKPANNVANPSFTNVAPSKVAAEEGVVETKYVDFHGTLNKRTISETEIDNQSVIFLTGTIVDGNQQLTWANGGILKGMRAYWKVEEGTPASVMAKRPVLQIGNGENTTTDLEQVPSDKIQCTKVLRDGQIYILRGEKAYNLQGIEIDRPNKL